MRKFAVLLICIVLSLSFCISPLSSAAGPDLLLLNYNTSTSIIYQDTVFYLNLSLKNNSSSSLHNVYLQLDQSSAFFPVDTGSTVFIASEITAGQTISASVRLKYDGSSNTRMSLKFKYEKDASDLEQTEFITINTLNLATPPSDTSKSHPRIIIDSTNTIPLGRAGQLLSFRLRLKNISSYEAKNVSIYPALDEVEGKPFVIDKMDPVYRIDSIKSNEYKETTMSFTVSRTAPSGTYALKLNFKYFNIHGDPFTLEEKIFVKIENSLVQPKLVPQILESNPYIIKAGSEGTIVISIKNEGTETARDIKATLSGLRGDGFSINGSMDTKYVSDIAGGGQNNVLFIIKASPKMESGNHSLTFKLDYKDGMNTPHSVETQFFVPVEKEDKVSLQPVIEIENIKSPEGPVVPGEDFDLEFDLKNTGLAKAHNVKVVVSTDKELIMKSLNTRVVNAVESGSSQKFKFVLSAADDTPARNYTVSINVEYEHNNEGSFIKQSASQFIGVLVDNPGKAGEDKSVPRIIINSYSYDPAPVKPGDNFKLKVSLLNTNKTSAVKNIKMVLNAAEGVFIPVESSNTLYIDRIEKSKSVQKDIMLNVLPGVQAKVHSLSVDMEYEDEKGNPINAKEVISIPVVVDPRLVTGEITLPPEIFVGQPFPVFLEFYNMGKVTLYNMMVKAEGDFQVQNANYFVGNFEPGRSDSFEAAVIPMQQGSSKGSIVFAFEDADGKSHEIKKEFTINAVEMPPIENLPADGGMEGPTKNPGLFSRIVRSPILWVSVVLLAGLAAFFIVKRVRGRREEMMLDE